MSNINSSNPNLYTGRPELTEQYKTQKAEKDELAEEHRAEMENLKNSYANEQASNQDRFETSIQQEKNSHYDYLRNMKSQLNREERQLSHLKDQVVTQKNDEMKTAERKAENDGSARVKTAIQKYAAAEEYEHQRALKAEEDIRTNHHASAAKLISDSQKQLEAMGEDKRIYLENQKAGHAEALGQIKEHYQASRTQAENQYRSETKNLMNRAGAELNQKREALSTMLEEYDTKHDDPFYNIQKLDSQLFDMGEAFVIRVKVPEYERENFKVHVSGQEVQLQGTRSSDESVQVEPGRVISTRNHQNIAEKFVLDSPVDGRNVTYTEDGDYLEYTIPKFGPGHRVEDSYRKPTSFSLEDDTTRELNFVNNLPRPKLPPKAEA